MLKSPKNTKFKYQFGPVLPVKGRKGLGTPKNASIVIKSQNTCLLTPQQLEASRRILAKPIREEGGKLNIRFFPNLPLSKKPLQTRMGKGKGRHEKWVARIRKGAPLFCITGHIPVNIVKLLYRKVNFRMPVYSKVRVMPSPQNWSYTRITTDINKKIQKKNEQN